MASDRVKVKRQSLFAAEHGALFIAYTRTNLIVPYRILGTANKATANEKS